MKLEDKPIFVNYNSGSCGEFIITLLMLLQNPNRDVTVIDSGSCHKNRDSDMEPDLTVDFNLSDADTQEIIKQFKYRKINKAHVLNPNLIEEVIESTVIQITNERMHLQQSLNILFKVIFSEWDRYGKDTFYDICKDIDITHPNELTQQQLKTIVHDYLPPYIIQKNNNMLKFLENSNGNIIKLDMWDIYNNKQKVIEICQELVGVYDVDLNDFYDSYLNKQPTYDMIKNT
ncbi:MAG: hypothetical protein ACON4I_11120 [Candidatus Puniceispirillaceae bacterium]